MTFSLRLLCFEYILYNHIFNEHESALLLHRHEEVGCWMRRCGGHCQFIGVGSRQSIQDDGGVHPNNQTNQLIDGDEFTLLHEEAERVAPPIPDAHPCIDEL